MRNTFHLSRRLCQLRSNCRYISSRHLSTRWQSLQKQPVRAAASTAGLLGLLATGFGLFTLMEVGKQDSSLVPIASRPSTIHNLSKINIDQACREFTQVVGNENVSTDFGDLLSHSGSDYQSCDWTEQIAKPGHLIVYPTSTEEVSDVVKICHRRSIPVTPYSGGTSVEGQYIPDLGGVCIDFSRMCHVVEINRLDMDCVVQPGVGWMDLNAELASHNLFFPPDPGPGATIGGMIGTGCSGTNAAAYGTMKDWVLSLTVVLADGSIIRTRRRPRKSSAGYDLTRIFIGSEGTLGLVTEATLKLAVKPKYEVVAVCTFGDLSSAARVARGVMSQGVQVSAVEILDEVQMASINKAGLTTRTWKEEPTLFFKFSGHTQTSLAETSQLVGQITNNHGCTSYVSAADDAERDELWSARKNALWSMIALKASPSDKVWVTDVAVPLSRLPDIVQQTKADIEDSSLRGSIVGHVGDGNFHSLILFPEDKRSIAEGLVKRMV